MQFDYDLVPETGEYPTEALAEMATYLSGQATHRLSDGTFIVFPDADARAARMPALLRQEPDWLDGYVKLAADRVTLGLVSDDAVRRQLHEFATWSAARWPAHLDYFGSAVPFDELLPA